MGLFDQLMAKSIFKLTCEQSKIMLKAKGFIEKVIKHWSLYF